MTNARRGRENLSYGRPQCHAHHRHSASAIGQKETSGALLIERAPDPETDDADLVAGCSPATIGRSDLVSKAGPGTAAEAMAAAIASHPRRSIDRCTHVILV